MNSPLPPRSQGRDRNDGPAQVWRYCRAIGFVALALLGLLSLVRLVNTFFSQFEPRTLEDAPQQLEAMRNDPIAGFRAPGTDLRGQEEQPGQSYPLDGSVISSRVRLSFDMRSQPGDTVEAYLQAAQTMGWTWVTDGCSRTERATGAVFSKTLVGYDARLVVEAYFPDPGEGPGGLLFATLEVPEPASIADLNFDIGLHRNDVHCLRGLDPSHPDLQAPKLVEMTSEELCALIPLTEVRVIFPKIVRAEPVVLVGEQTCQWLEEPAFQGGTPGFDVWRARQPRAYYEDRRLAGSEASDQFFSFSVYGKEHPEFHVRAVWVSGPGGPFVVEDLENPPPDEDPLLEVARLLADDDVPVPTSAPTTVAGQELDSGVLIEFMVDGGIAGNSQVTVTDGDWAVYQSGIGPPVRFELPAATMVGLRTALSQLEFGDFSSTYGSHAGPDDQAEVLTYRGQTVRVWSDGPPELGPVTAILRRLLEEGASSR